MINKEGIYQQPQIVQIVRAAASVMASLLMAIAIIAIWRRYAGAFQAPLPSAMFLAVGLIVIGPTLVIRNWWRLVTRSQNIPPIEVVCTLCSPTISTLAILVAISVPGTSPLGVLLLGLLFIAGEATVYRPRKRTVCAASTAGTLEYTESEIGLAPQPEEMPVPDSHLNTDLALDKNTQPEPGVSQQLIRCRTEEGLDCLKGWVRVDIPAGRRAQSVHLAFCPAFEQAPKITVQPEEDAPANRIKIVQCLPYGAHLEIKLPKASPADETFTLRFQAEDSS